MECIPFDLSHTIYLNILHIINTLGGLEGIYYIALLNKILWDQGVYLVFNGLDDATKNEIMVKRTMIARQQNFGPLKIKSMRLTMKITWREVPQVDEEEKNIMRKVIC